MNVFFDFDTAESSLAPTPDQVARRAEVNRSRDALFELDVKRVGWRRLRPGDSLDPWKTPRVFVIGVALWNQLDRTILKEAAERWRQADVAVFNLDDVHSAAQFAAFVPGVPMPTETPVVAEYDAGQLRGFATAAAALALISKQEERPSRQRPEDHDEEEIE
ncbi:MAG TPA: hypothetical protein VGF69_08155 [Thermoanaerobaculia bacterium]|jgi:hypothetical protein